MLKVSMPRVSRLELTLDLVEPRVIGSEDVTREPMREQEALPDAVTLVSTTSGAFGAFVQEMSIPAELTECAARHGIEILGPPGALPS
jgi:hypothetical protein